MRVLVRGMGELRSFRDVAGRVPAEPQRRHRPDYWLLILTVALLGIGLIVVYAISPALAAVQDVNAGYFVSRQALAVGAGIVAFAVAANVPLSLWKRLCVPMLLFAGLVTVLALLMPVDPRYPAHRWIRLGGFSFQSVELLKFAFLVWLSGFLAQRARAGQVADFRLTVRPVLATLVGLGLVVAGLQHDLGSMVVITAIIGLVLFVSGLPARWLAMAAAVVLVLGTVFIASTPYRRERLATFVNQSASCQN